MFVQEKSKSFQSFRFKSKYYLISCELNPSHGCASGVRGNDYEKMRIKLMMTRLTAVDLFVWHESLGGGRRATIDVLIRPTGGSYSCDSLSWGESFLNACLEVSCLCASGLRSSLQLLLPYCLEEVCSCLGLSFLGNSKGGS